MGIAAHTAMKKPRDKPRRDLPPVGPPALSRDRGVDPNLGLSCRVVAIVKRKRKKP